MIINFSHPLRPEAAAKIKEMFPGEKIAEVKCHVDFNAPLKPQLQEIVEQARAAAQGQHIPAYISPALSYIAVYVDGALQSKIIVLKNVGTTSPMWMPTGELL